MRSDSTAIRNGAIVHDEVVTADVERVDDFVSSLTSEWQRVACGALLEDIRGVGLLREHIKWGQPYFERDGAAVLKWFCSTGWINVYFFRGRELDDPKGLFEPSSNVRMLTVRITPSRGLDREAFQRLVHEAAELAGL